MSNQIICLPQWSHIRPGPAPDRLPLGSALPLMVLPSLLCWAGLGLLVSLAL